MQTWRDESSPHLHFGPQMKTAITRRNRLRNSAFSGAGLLSLRDRHSRSGSYHAEWGQACQGTGKAFSGFEMAGTLTELMRPVDLPTLAEGRAEYGAIGERVLNSKAASRIVKLDYGKEWLL